MISRPLILSIIERYPQLTLIEYKMPSGIIEYDVTFRRTSDFLFVISEQNGFLILDNGLSDYLRINLGDPSFISKFVLYIDLALKALWKELHE